MEVSIVPEVWTTACELLKCLAEQSVTCQFFSVFIEFSCRFPWRLDSHVGRLLSILVARLEEKPDMYEIAILHFLSYSNGTFTKDPDDGAS